MRIKSLKQILAACLLLCSVCVSCKKVPLYDWDYSLAGEISFICGYPILEVDGSYEGEPLNGLKYGDCSFFKYSDTAVSLHCSIGWEKIKFAIEIPYIPLSGKPDDLIFNYVSTDSVFVSNDPDAISWDDAITYTPENTVIRGWVKVDMISPSEITATRSIVQPPCTCEINIVTWLDGKELNIKITAIGW